jgi:hypothetical protein
MSRILPQSLVLFLLPAAILAIGFAIGIWRAAHTGRLRRSIFRLLVGIQIVVICYPIAVYTGTIALIRTDTRVREVFDLYTLTSDFVSPFISPIVNLIGNTAQQTYEQNTSQSQRIQNAANTMAGILTGGRNGTSNQYANPVNTAIDLVLLASLVALTVYTIGGLILIRIGTLLIPARRGPIAHAASLTPQ